MNQIIQLMNAETGLPVTTMTLADLADQEFWIADTGASTHMAKHDNGMVNIGEATSSEGLTMWNKGRLSFQYSSLPPG